MEALAFSHSLSVRVFSDLQRLRGYWKWRGPANSDLVWQLGLQKRINTHM